MKYELKRDEGGKITLTINMEFKTIEEATKILTSIENIGNLNLDSMELQLLPFLKEGQLLAAVKYYKEATGNGLKESKDYTDALREKLKRLQLI